MDYEINNEPYKAFISQINENLLKLIVITRQIESLSIPTWTCDECQERSLHLQSTSPSSSFHTDLRALVMSESSEESRRVSVQISSLSTQLIESIDKQSQLEEKLNQAKRTIQTQKNSIQSYNDLKLKYNKLENDLQAKDQDLESLKDDLAKERELRATAERTVDDLNKEIEDLTASLFDEANKMVATARKESHTIEVKNHKLMEQLAEKDTILETLNLQLKNLKKVLQNLDNEGSSRISVAGNDNSTSSVSLNKTLTSNSGEQSSGPIFSPTITSIRYDLSLYTEFLKFIAVLPYCETLKDTSSDSKLLRRLVNDEIQPVLRLDNASGLGWIVRRTLMSLMMDGLVVVEPLSGLNENFQYGHATPTTPNLTTGSKDSHLFSYPSDSPPIAVHDKCSFCSEARDDIIEHARMYVLKTQTRAEDGSLIVTNSFPLCRYCLLKIRQTCEIFAFLRSLKLGAWNLEKVTLSNIAKGESGKFSEVFGSNQKEPKLEDKKSHRMSFISGANQSSKVIPQVDTSVSQVGAPTTNIQRAWLQLCKLRATLHWAHIGVWSTEDAVSQKIGPVVKEPEENDHDSTYQAEEGFPVLQRVTSANGSFTLKKGDDEDAFDFEKMNTSLPEEEEKQADISEVSPNNPPLQSVQSEEEPSDLGGQKLKNRENAPLPVSSATLADFQLSSEEGNSKDKSELLPEPSTEVSVDHNEPSGEKEAKTLKTGEKAEPHSNAKHMKESRGASNDAGSISMNEDEFDDAIENQDD